MLLFLFSLNQENLSLFIFCLLVNLPCFLSAFLPSVKGPGILRGAGTVLWCRDSISAGLPACWKKRGLSRSKGRRWNVYPLSLSLPLILFPLLFFSSSPSFPSFLCWHDINRVCLYPEQWQWPELIDLPPPDQSPDLTAAVGRLGLYAYCS